MKSIQSLYKIGVGPSSSHTMGPERACLKVKELYNNVNSVDVMLYGSLALTGVGHLTDKIIIDTLKPIQCNLAFDYTSPTPEHANTMTFDINLDTGETIRWTIFSIGGGDLIIKELDQAAVNEDIYPLSTFNEFKDQYQSADAILDYMLNFEQGLDSHLDNVIDVMLKSVERGLNTQTQLPGKLNLARKASEMLEAANTKELKISAYAQATSEENAGGGRIVTAPTCGACGIIPGLIYYFLNDEKVDYNKVKRGLLMAGLIGDIIRHNASISGAEAGCQAEVGSATSMAAAMIAYIQDQDIDVIETASIIGLEHQLGLTCDPVLGYVQVPCINRNAMGAVKALMSAEYAKTRPQTLINLDQMIEVMLQTGKDLQAQYRETSLGGIAKMYEQNHPELNN